MFLPIVGRVRRFLRAQKLFHDAHVHKRFLPSLKRQLSKADSWVEAYATYLSNSTIWDPKQIKCPAAHRILAISPHPDDETIGCGGFLLLHSGHSEIRIATVYDGALGGQLEDNKPPEATLSYRLRMRDARKAELRRVADSLGATVGLSLDIPEEGGVWNEKDRTTLREFLLEFQPEIVLLPWFLDGHPHHIYTNQLFAAASDGLECMVMGYETWTPASHNSFVDISDVLNRKLELISFFRTQLRTVDYIKFAENMASFRGFHARVGGQMTGAVEVFISLRRDDYSELVTALSLHQRPVRANELDLAHLVS